MIFKVVKDTDDFFGVECYDNKKLVATFPQLSTNKEAIRQFTKLLNEDDVDFTQLEYFLEDFLT